MPPDENALRVTFSLGAFAGGVVLGLVILLTRVFSGQPVRRQDVILAVANVAAAIVTGVLVAYFLGPALGPLVPVESLREPHALGFGIGAGAWEVAPLVLGGWRAWVTRKLGGGAA